jgi:hypothetical protein
VPLLLGAGAAASPDLGPLVVLGSKQEATVRALLVLTLYWTTAAAAAARDTGCNLLTGSQCGFGCVLLLLLLLNISTLSISFFQSFIYRVLLTLSIAAVILVD